MEQIQTVYNTLPGWMQIAVLVIGMCKMVTFWTPTKIDDEWFGKLTPLINGALKALNAGGANIWRDKNKDDRK
jgi:hypothetical protein|tara:strand:- start:162 stop:380 length:219 start_codon:yes stop_codon:yes gene_type:complete